MAEMVACSEPSMSYHIRIRVINNNQIINISLYFWIARSVTSWALISGFKSYVATFGDGIKIYLHGDREAQYRHLKKVTCAYFSVSALQLLPS